MANVIAALNKPTLIISHNKTLAGKLADYVRKKFEEKFSPEEMEKLANSKASKVPFDAQDNRNTETYVEGLSAYYHRMLSLINIVAISV